MPIPISPVTKSFTLSSFGDLAAQIPKALHKWLQFTLTGADIARFPVVYGMEFGGLEVHFKVDGEVLTVTNIDRR